MKHPMLALLALSFFSLTHARVVGAAVIPHGDFALDPSLVGGKNGSTEIHEASKRAGKAVEALGADVIFLSTPHGISLTDNFIVYKNTNGSGFALIGQDLHDPAFKPYKVPLDTRMAPELAAELVRTLGHAHNVSGLLAFADTEAIALRWGEVIPLWFLGDYLSTARPSLLVLSQSQRRSEMSEAFMKELTTLGARIFDFLEALPEKVVIVVSSDLAHTHLASGPYGYSPMADPFDQACCEWATTFNQETLLVRARKMADEALSCGYSGLVMLNGALTHSSSEFVPHFYGYAAPTYYGMMASVFSRVD